MKIYKMTATFGKLEKATLELKPGLNIIEAPNEWGKSTWCAFLVAMLYGIDTKERTTKDALAAKERYAPWSGLPMEGSMDICWQGRDITIQRSQQGRTPFGAFQAFETETGLPVAELTASNCGKVLLGIDKSVFTRTAFLRLQDLPITDDGALRDRLNALVTTGDESGAEKSLVETLNKLKNACRHNKTGKLPEAEREREEILDLIRQMETLTAKEEALNAQKESLETQLSTLNNHKAHLLYQQAEQEATLLANAKAETARLTAEIAKTEKALSSQPPAEETKYKLSQLAILQEKWAILQEKPQPEAPQKPISHPAFAGLNGEEAVKKARTDYDNWKLQEKPQSPLFLILAILSYVAGLALLAVNPVFIGTGVAIGSMFMVLYNRGRREKEKKKESLSQPYGDLAPDAWLSTAESYHLSCQRYELTYKAYSDALLALDREKAVLSAELGALTLGKPVSECMALWNDHLRLREDFAQLQKDLQKAISHQQALSSVIKTVSAPQTEDLLTLSLPETEKAIAYAEQTLRTLSSELHQYAGKKALLGEKGTYEHRLADINRRISLLEEHYAALSIALETAVNASQNLQRRFAPGISQEAQAIFQSLTGGRYDRLVLNQDFSLQTSAKDETALHSAQWRSDGTIDQLYFALRLAVSKTLSPVSPLILDDALVRFDDVRLETALSLLQTEAETKQVLLFTCQNREQLTINK